MIWLILTNDPWLVAAVVLVVLGWLAYRSITKMKNAHRGSAGPS